MPWKLCLGFARLERSLGRLGFDPCALESIAATWNRLRLAVRLESVSGILEINRPDGLESIRLAVRLEFVSYAWNRLRSAVLSVSSSPWPISLIVLELMRLLICYANVYCY